jgi:1-aminocyclopropane-1-carboxylate deaminase/D-cysteine desulfhydrase-like pyridoxal-dependent ACC family enzyme
VSIGENPHRPLFERYPGLRGNLPWVALGDLPTPVERLDGLPGEAELWVKRDDISGTPYGGNKVRKLEFLLADALERGAREVATFGAAGSNHALATAVYGQQLGLDVTLFLMRQPRTSYVAANLLADVAFGADVRHFDDRQHAEAGAWAYAERARHERGVEPYIIPFGGTTPLSVGGDADAGLEVAEQIESGELPKPDIVYVAVGSGGTAAGIALGLALAGVSCEILGVRVTPEEVIAEASFRRLVRQGATELRERDASVPDIAEAALAGFRLRGDQFGDGYAVGSPAGADAIRQAAEAGMTLEGTYTGKAFAALLGDAAEGALAGKRVLFWNTYNSRELGPHIEGVSPTDLPESAREYFAEG